MNNLLTQKFPIAAFALLFVLTVSCSEEPETTEKPMPNVVNWNDSTINGDAVMGSAMTFRVGDSLQVIRKASTRLSTAFDGQNYTLSGDERITIAMKRGSESEVIKIYKVKDVDTGALEYEKDADNNVTEPFYWKSTTETVKLRAWSYGTSEAYTSDPLTTPFTLNTTQTELVVGKDNYRELLYDKQRDYPYAANITLNLYHQLARITVELTNSATSDLSIATNGVTIGGGVLPTSAQFVAPTGDSNIGSWEDLQTNSGTVTARTDVANQKYSAVVFPKTYSAGTKIVGVTTTAESPWNSYAYTLPSGGEELEAGKQYSYKVNVRDLVLVSGLTVSDIAAVTYNGSAQTPEPTVTDPESGKVLTKDTHYTLSYTNNTNAGTATCTVTGKGIYSGTQNKNFTINRKDLTGTSEFQFASTSVTRDYIWEIGTGTNALTKPGDCTVTYTSDNTAVASVSDAATGTLLPGGTLNTNATITATATGNYSGTATYTIKATSKEKTFDYINNTIQSENVCKGTYQFEVWGAQGGTIANITKYLAYQKGGYSKGNKTLTSQTPLFVCVGGAGGSGIINSANSATGGAGGYNGGGMGGNSTTSTSAGGGGGGGGATHIALSTGTLYTLLNNASTKNNVLIVAGGGGGCVGHQVGGTGGGSSGGASQSSYALGLGSNKPGQDNIPINPATTSTNYYQLGQGQKGVDKTVFAGHGTAGCGGGGGGYYGGKAYQGTGVYSDVAGAGGTGYVGGVDGGVTSNGVRSGNGAAKITWVSN